MDRIRSGLFDVFGHDSEIMKIRMGERAISHLFKVATTLDSMILGEHQILGQVKDALEFSKKIGAVGPELTPLFERACRAGRRVRCETELCCGNISMASVAVGAAESFLGSLEGKTALILGAGKISSMVATILGSKGLDSILVTNRTLDTALGLARRTGARAVAYETFKDYLSFSDVVFCASSAPHPLLYRKDLVRARSLRTADIAVIDAAMPPDVDAGAKDTQGIRYFGLESIRDYTKKTEQRRREHLPRAREIIAEEHDALMRTYQLRKRKDLVRDISIHAETVRMQEIEKLLAGACHDPKSIEACTRAIVKKTLHTLYHNIQDPDIPYDEVTAVRDLFLNNNNTANKRNKRCE